MASSELYGAYGRFGDFIGAKYPKCKYAPHHSRHQMPEGAMKANLLPGALQRNRGRRRIFMDAAAILIATYDAP